MVGKALDEFASARQLRKEKGMVFGWLHGFMVSLDEGMGYKDLLISAHMEKDAVKRFLGMAQGSEFVEKYQILEADYQDGRLAIRFRDKAGSMGRIEAFIDKCLPGLKANGLSCPYCRENVDMDNCRLAMYEGMVQPLHSHCMDAMGENRRNADTAKDADNAHNKTAKGFVGALLGALAGALPWVVALCINRFIVLFGFVIGLCSKKGYEMMKGRAGGVKIVSVVVCTLLAVVAAQVVGYIAMAALEIAREPLYGMGVVDAPSVAFEMLTYNSELASAFIGDMLLGGLFALFGCGGLMLDMRRDKRARQAQDEFIDVT